MKREDFRTYQLTSGTSIIQLYDSGVLQRDFSLENVELGQKGTAALVS